MHVLREIMSAVVTSSDVLGAAKAHLCHSGGGLLTRSRASARALSIS